MYTAATKGAFDEVEYFVPSKPILFPMIGANTVAKFEGGPAAQERRRYLCDSGIAQHGGLSNISIRICSERQSL